MTIIPGSKAILGFSGGVDSVVLSHWLLQRYNIRPYLLHVNYGLREEADEDERWCRWFAQEHRFEIEVLHADPTKRKGENIQNWARKLRYHWFEERAQALGAEYIFTAHHLDDRKETFLMNALRGAGLTGLTGMSHPHILRPLAQMSKADILAFAQEHELTWREDASNQTLKYTRNKVRNLLPQVLDEVEPRWHGGLAKTIDNLVRDRELLEGMLDEFEQHHVREFEDEVHIDFGTWIEQPYAQTLLYRYCLRWDLGFSYEECGHVLKGDSGQLTPGRQKILVKDRTAFILAPKKELDPNTYTIHGPEDLSNLPFALTLKPTPRAQIVFDDDHEWISPSAAPFPWTIRVWKPGDAFLPLGMKGSKKVADFLNDLRLPRHRKKHIYVALHNDEIFWVLGYRIAAHVKVVEGDDMAYLASLKL